jgi:hypothetical protein
LKDNEAQDLLNEYHRHLHEATEKYPTKAVNLKYLKMLELENRRQVKNSFSMLPPGHQEIITQTIEATIE